MGKGMAGSKEEAQSTKHQIFHGPPPPPEPPTDNDSNGPMPPSGPLMQAQKTQANPTAHPPLPHPLTQDM